MTPQQKLNELLRLYDNIEKQMVDLALEHNLYLNLGEDGQGSRRLILEDDNSGWRELKRGDWMTSTMDCS